jgi:MYXO-CTERM domain-containing protein
MPRAETCNAFDDDCDGVIDNGNLCDGGKVCFSGLCLTRGEAADAALAMRPEPGPDGGPGREGDAAVSLEPRAPAFDAGAPGTATGEPGGGRTPEPSSGGCSHGAAAPPAGAALLGVAAALALVSRRRRR